jgi:hypothetical protein
MLSVKSRYWIELKLNKSQILKISSPKPINGMSTNMVNLKISHLDVSRFLDHSSLAVTTVYLRRLEGEQDKSWAKVAEAIGI